MSINSVSIPHNRNNRGRSVANRGRECAGAAVTGAAVTGAAVAAGLAVVAAPEGYNDFSDTSASMAQASTAAASPYAIPAPYTGGTQLSEPTPADSPRMGGTYASNNASGTGLSMMGSNMTSNMTSHMAMTASGMSGVSAPLSHLGDESGSITGSQSSRAIRVRTTRRSSLAANGGAVDTNDAFTQRLGDSFATSVLVNSRALSARSGSSLGGLSRVSSRMHSRAPSGGGSVGEYAAGPAMTQVFGASSTVGVSAWASASVMSDGTTVYTDIGCAPCKI